MPYDEYLELIHENASEATIPQEVIEFHILDKKSIIKAWREYKKLSQQEVADCMGISQAAYSQMERADARLKKATLKKIAHALNLKIEQMEI